MNKSEHTKPQDGIMRQNISLSLAVKCLIQYYNLKHQITNNRVSVDKENLLELQVAQYH